MSLLSELVAPELVTLNIDAKDAHDAIRKATRTLVTQGKVADTYIQGMIDSLEEFGPYYVVTEYVAIPHARPEEGAYTNAISIGVLNTPVNFGSEQNDPVKYLFGLSAPDSEGHLEAMMLLVGILEDDEFYDVLNSATSAEEIINYIHQFEKGGQEG